MSVHPVGPQYPCPMPNPTAFPSVRAALAAAGVPEQALVTPARTGSTNADLLAAAADQPHGAIVVTLDQTSGRGRLDRTWSAPAGQTLAASVLVRAELSDVDRGWLPLVAGAAMRDAVVAVLPDGVDVSVKWPNDVLVRGVDGIGRKICGILAQVAADGSVVVGAGVNLTIPADELPTPTSTSVAAESGPGEPAELLADTVLARFWTGLREAVTSLQAGGAAADATRARVRAVCGTIGTDVRVELPGGDLLEGTATGIDDEGRITIRTRLGEDRAISVGDVTHLRYA